MSRTELTIIHCDNCGETVSFDDPDEALKKWFRVEFYLQDIQWDYCSGRCLFAHSGVQPAGDAS